MRIPIRMIGIATTFFWIFLIAFSVSAAYSAKDIQFRFSEPQARLGANNELLFSLPVTIGNKGFYNIGHFNVTSEIADVEGAEITRGSTFVRVIRKGEEVTAFHNLIMNVNDLLQRTQSYLFNDSSLIIRGSVGLKLAEVIPVRASANFTLPWGAPLYGFALGTPAYSAANVTHFRVAVPVSFENHAFFDLTGNFQLRMYNNMDSLVGVGQTSVYAPQHTRYDGFVDFNILTTGITTSGRFEVYFSSPIFNYGPWVIPYG